MKIFGFAVLHLTLNQNCHYSRFSLVDVILYLSVQLVIPKQNYTRILKSLSKNDKRIYELK